MAIQKVVQLAWRRFLSTEAGQAGLYEWQKNAPRIPIGDSHEIVFAAGKTEGYKLALDFITEIIGAEPEKQFTEPEDLMHK